ncbi:hypothetical protein DL93DRAFT_2172998 [Clavulina sp. PMI_390]|nr:hypothetical protein DL93DRAFT_2172998 [Clavulina sp. PMI_390]
MNPTTVLLSTPVVEKQQYKKAPTDSTERKEPRRRKRYMRHSPQRTSAHQAYYQRQYPSSTPLSPGSARRSVFTSPRKHLLSRAGIVITTTVVLVLMLIALTMLAPRLPARPMPPTTLICSTEPTLD